MYWWGLLSASVIFTGRNQTDLVSFLNAQGEQLVKSGKEYRWKKHDSVTISGNSEDVDRGRRRRQAEVLPRPV